MTNNRGYIYILANSAMPDLVKVGKTTRTPAERAAELSKVTGVPTPFIVVYEQLVDDCTAAEQFVHTMLQQKGYRESDNREFFRASVNEVIRIVMQLPNQISNDATLDENDTNKAVSRFRSRGKYQSRKIQPPWLDLWKMAGNYHYGHDDYIRDYDEAIKLYEQAIKLGCLPAYEKIAGIYSGLSNTKKALEWYKEGVKKGNYYCYAGMGDIFASTGQSDDFHKCYKLLLKNRNEQRNEIIEKFSNDFKDYCLDYMMYGLKNNDIPCKEMSEAISAEKRGVTILINEKIGIYESWEGEDFSFMISPLKTSLKWLEENL